MNNVVVCELDHQRGDDGGGVRSEGSLFDAITEQLATTWDFTPYPRCTLRQLQVIDRYVAAFASPQERTAAGALPDVKTLVAVVGIVWVPLSTSTTTAPASRKTSSSLLAAKEVTLPCVEGYIQLVLVAPTHRRRGLAIGLLRRCLDMRVVASRRASGETGYGASDLLRRIMRWRLHTMLDTHTTRHYLQAPCLDDGKNGTQHVTQRATEEVRAVCRMYEKMGFVRRRTLYSYYCHKADAVEMVRTEAGCRKTSRR